MGVAAVAAVVVVAELPLCVSNLDQTRRGSEWSLDRE